MFSVKEYKPRVKKCNGRHFNLFTINNNKYSFNEKNMHTIFGLEKVYNSNIFKWCIDEEQIMFFMNLESEILETIRNYDKPNLGDINNNNKNIIIRNNYPTMLNTVVPPNAYDVIEHEKGDIPSYNKIEKHKKYDLHITINNIYVNTDKKEISFKYLVTKII